MSDELDFYRFLGLGELVSISELSVAAIGRRPELTKMQKEPKRRGLIVGIKG